MISPSRRDFLKLSSLSAAALASMAFDASLPFLRPWPVEEFETPVEMKARVTISAIYIYQEPDFKSTRIGNLKRDKIFTILEEITAPKGPIYNPRWYQLAAGYVHSAYTQRVDNIHPNLTLDSIPEGGQLGEISLPFVDSLRKLGPERWLPLWRLYYQSTHWITHLEQGNDGIPWYGLTDELLHVQYYVPANSVRPIQANELLPISVDIPEKDKRLEVSITEQTMLAYEGSELVRIAQISTGVHTKNLPADVLPTDTPTGNFHIQVKVPSKHMGDGRLTSDIEAYELLGVPWVSFFHKDGIAFHGTYWHDNFGHKMSHGCINMRNEDAKWLYRWSQPIAEAQEWNKKGWGTRLRIDG